MLLFHKWPFWTAPSPSATAHPAGCTVLFSPHLQPEFSWPYFNLRENVWWREGSVVEDAPTLPSSPGALQVELTLWYGAYWPRSPS